MRVFSPRWLGVGLTASVALVSLRPLWSNAVAVTPTAVSIDYNRELFITDLGVVEDATRTKPGGAWHFGTMMANIAGDVSPALFVDRWLNTFINPPPNAPIVNGEIVFEQTKADTVAELRHRWKKDWNGKLDLDAAPFRLLAIVNRPDLVKVGSGGPTSYGECRFIYGAFDPCPDENNPGCNETSGVVTGGPLRFFVIFEFDVPAASCGAVLAWAEQWHALGSLTLGSASYNNALQDITDMIVLRDTNCSRPNQTHLNQLRWNEFDSFALNPAWSLREWNVIAPGSNPNLALLKTVTTKQTPHLAMTSTPAGKDILREYLDGNRLAILAGQHVVPDYFQRPNGPLVSFQGGNAINHCTPLPGGSCTSGGQAGLGASWWSPGYDGSAGQTLDDADVRHKFALQTCQGCHQRETGTVFSMVTNRTATTTAQLSGFLKGTTLNDPVFTWVPRSFNDLDHRIYVLNRMLALNCSTNPLSQLAEMQSEMGTRVH